MNSADAADARRLLATLATPPPADAGPHLDQLRAATARIRSTLENPEHDTVGVEVLYQWRTDLDTHLHPLDERTPDPGTWLDSLRRLRRILRHEVAKAYWSDHTAITIARIDVARHLWGHR